MSLLGVVLVLLASSLFGCADAHDVSKDGVLSPNQAPGDDAIAPMVPEGDGDGDGDGDSDGDGDGDGRAQTAEPDPPCGGGDESCDVDNLDGETCESLGEVGGELRCDPVTCMFDTSMCTGAAQGAGGTGGAQGFFGGMPSQ